MNNNIDREVKIKALECKLYVQIAQNDPSAKQEIIRGGGSSGGVLTKLLMTRPIKKLRVTEDALKICYEHNINPFDYFIYPDTIRRKKFGNFFSSNIKDIKKCHEIGHYLTGDHNIPNRCVIDKMMEIDNSILDEDDVTPYIKILNEQSYDLITLEENERLNKSGLQSKGTKEERDAICSKKYEFKDLWLTPQYVIDDFFKLTNLDKTTCLDPCAADGRWLGNNGYSIDIIPMKPFVKEQDFLTMKKEQLPSNIKTIVGNLPFSLLDEFVNKSFELCDDCYFLVNGDTIFKHFPEHIEHIYIFSGIEGNQKDNRSRCEFDVPYLFKSQLWCCIVHLTKEKQPSWNIETNISNEEKRDGFHIALGKNVYIKSDVLVDDNPKISRINVNSSIKYKNGKKIKFDDEYIDVKKISEIF